MLGAQDFKARRRGEALQGARSRARAGGAAGRDDRRRDVEGPLRVGERQGRHALPRRAPRVPDGGRARPAAGPGRRDVDGARRLDWSTTGSAPRLPPGKRLVDADGDEPDDLFDDPPGESSSTAASSAASARARSSSSRTIASSPNVSLAAPDNAQLFLDLLRFTPLATEVEICDEWTGVGAETPFAAVRERVPQAARSCSSSCSSRCSTSGGAAPSRASAIRPPRAAAPSPITRAPSASPTGARAPRATPLGLYAVWALERLRERVHRVRPAGPHPAGRGRSPRAPAAPRPEVMRVLVERRRRA